MTKIIFFLIALVLVIFGAGYVWYSASVESRRSDSTEEATVEIAPGTSSVGIGEKLLQENLIGDLNVWQIYLRLNSDAVLKAGNFEIPRDANIPEIVRILAGTGLSNSVRVTFLEGWRNSQYAEQLEKSFATIGGSVFSQEEFLTIVANPDGFTFSTEAADFLGIYKPAGKSLEGFLYPNTYEFAGDASTLSIINSLIVEHVNRTRNLDLPSDYYNKLVLASIVEKESFTNEEKATIASVFSNRLRIGQALQSDATVNYATGNSNPRPTFAELAIDSPYNTYKYPGLPPTPINNPRLESIQAALNPASTSYFYFIHQQDGSSQVRFARTYAEHLENVRIYLD